MKKPDSLRRHLEACIPSMKSDPQNLHLFVEKGNIVSRFGGLSFEYRYTLNLIATDFTADANDLIIPLLAWVQINQPDILQNPDKQENTIRIEVEILDQDTVDLSILIDLTERVIVTISPTGSYTATQPDEPALPDLDGPTGWGLLVAGANINQP